MTFAADRMEMALSKLAEARAILAALEIHYIAEDIETAMENLREEITDEVELNV